MRPAPCTRAQGADQLQISWAQLVFQDRETVLPQLLRLPQQACLSNASTQLSLEESTWPTQCTSWLLAFERQAGWMRRRGCEGAAGRWRRLS